MSDFAIWLPALTILGSFVAAYLGAVFAFRRFRSERWLDKKMNIYGEILEVLNELLEIYDTYVDHEMSPDREIPIRKKRELYKKSQNAKMTLRKWMRIGSFTIDGSAVIVLSELINAMEKINT
jgi:hypothetical protein